MITEVQPGTLAALDAELVTFGRPTTQDALLALPVAPGSASRLLRGPAGEACLLIAASKGSGGADLKLRNVQAKAKVRCKIEAPDGNTAVVDGALVTCTASDPQLRRLFLDLMDEALAALGDDPSGEAIAAWLHRLAMLFARLEQQGRTRLRGLWAELATMIALGDAALAARRWHTDPQERFDFLAGSFAVEVKSCQDLDRVHHFSLGQLQPPAGLEVWVASVVVRADPQGQSVLDLLQEIETGIADGRTRDSLRAMVFASGGSALEDDDMHRFDRAGALATLRLLDVRAIPSITESLPEEIVAVSLKVRCRDLASVGSLDLARSRLQGAAT